MRKTASVLDLEASRPELPADVANLYTWARLEGARYRDFSAARRESRARSRQRAAQMRYLAETSAREAAEQNALQSERAADLAEAEARFHEAMVLRALGEGRTSDLGLEERAFQAADREARYLALQAASARTEANRRAQAQASAKLAEHREAREAAEAHASAVRQAERYGTAQSGLSASRATLIGADRQIPAHDPVSGSGFGLSLQPAMQSQRFPSRRSSGTAVPDRESDSSTLSGSVVIEATQQLVQIAHPGTLPLSALKASLQAQGERPFYVAPHTPSNFDDDRSARSGLRPDLNKEIGREEVVPAWLREHAEQVAADHDPKPQRAAKVIGRSVASTVLRASAKSPGELSDPDAGSGSDVARTDEQDGPDGMLDARANS